MEKKFGVYICTGCGIGEAVNIEKLKKISARVSKIEADNIRVHQILCSPEDWKL